MNKESIKVIPECLEKIGNFTPARHRETRKTLISTLPFAVLIVIIRYIHKERMVDKQYEHEELRLQMEHEEKMLEIEMEHEETMLQLTHTHEEIMEKIKAKLLSRKEESKHEKDN